MFRKICFILKLGLPVAAVPGALSPLAIPNAAAAAAAAAAGRVGMPGVSAGGNTVLLVSNLNEEVSETILLFFSSLVTLHLSVFYNFFAFGLLHLDFKLKVFLLFFNNPPKLILKPLLLNTFVFPGS